MPATLGAWWHGAPGGRPAAGPMLLPPPGGARVIRTETDPFATRASLWFASNGPRWLPRLAIAFHPNVRSLRHHDDNWVLDTRNESIFLSDPRQITRVIGPGMDGRVVDKYSYESTVAVEPGDVVVDVGAFIGEFARGVGRLADRVLAVEPDDRNAAALQRNLRHLDRADVVRAAAWCDSGERALQAASDPSQSTLIAPEERDVLDTADVETVRIDDLVRRRRLHRVDFLKVEARGAEPEVLEGLGGVEPRKIAVECSPARDGESPAARVREILDTRGYTVYEDGNILFGLLEEGR